MDRGYLISVDESTIDRDQHIILTYEVETTAGTTLGQIGEVIACDPTIGTWAVTRAETADIIEAYSGKLLLPLPAENKQSGVIRIAFPLRNIDPEIGGIPHLWAILGAPYTLRQIARLHLINIDIPPSFLAHLPGPRFGIQGIQEIVGLDEPRPLLATMLKPRTGLPALEYAGLALEAYRGGVDIIFDDELMVSPEPAPLFDRVARIKAAARQAEAETGLPKRYAANITSSVRYIRGIASEVENLGADFFYLNPMAAGLPVLEMLAADQDLHLPILCCRSGYGVLTRGQDGVAFFVLLKMARFCGADAMHVGSIGGRLPHAIIGDDSQLRSRISWLRARSHRVHPSLPILSGGLHPGNLERNIQRLGRDVIVQAGSGVLAHPDGPRAGGKAMRDALNAVLAGVPCPEAARASPELETALRRWGYLDEEGVHDLDALWAEPSPSASQVTIQTSGGAFVIGDVYTKGGDFIGRDQRRREEESE